MYVLVAELPQYDISTLRNHFEGTFNKESIHSNLEISNKGLVIEKGFALHRRIFEPLSRYQ